MYTSYTFASTHYMQEDAQYNNPMAPLFAHIHTHTRIGYTRRAIVVLHINISTHRRVFSSFSHYVFFFFFFSVSVRVLCFEYIWIYAGRTFVRYIFELLSTAQLTHTTQDPTWAPCTDENAYERLFYVRCCCC